MTKTLPCGCQWQWWLLKACPVHSVTSDYARLPCGCRWHKPDGQRQWWHLEPCPVHSPTSESIEQPEEPQ